MRKITLFLMLMVSMITTAYAQTIQRVEVALTTQEGLPGYVSSPHDHAVINPESQWDKGGVAALIDGDPNTHFHTAWENVPDGPHYFQVDLGEGNSISQFCFEYIARGGDAGDDFPSEFTVKGSNDNSGFEQIAVVDFTMPNTARETQGKKFSSEVIGGEKEYRYLRFEVTNTKSYNGAGYRTYFHVAEFDLFAMVAEELSEYTVTYRYLYNGTSKKTVTNTVLEGNAYPAYDLGLFGASYEGAPSGTVTKDEVIEIVVTFDELPFEFAATYDDIGEKWYYLSISSAEYLLYHVDDAEYIALNRTAPDAASSKDAYLWAFVGDPFDGYKLMNRAKGDGYILSSSINTFDGNTGAKTYPILTSENNLDGKNTYWVPTKSTNLGDGGFYLAQKDVNDGMNRMNNRDNKLAYWNGGADHGSTFKVLHKDYIYPITLNWNATTEWTAIDVADCASSLMWENRFSEGIKYVQTAVHVDSPVEAAVTFNYTGGSCRLNMTGVEVVDAQGNIVSCDYHFGYTGGDHYENIYSVKVAEAGTYTVRCYATEGNWSDEKGYHDDRFHNSNGRITLELAKSTTEEFAHSVTFAAKYATLYLGYKVAIPEGVKAYVAVSTNNGYVQFKEVEDVIPVATPVLLENVGENETYIFAYTDAAAETVATNLLKGSIANRYVMGDAYVLTRKNGEVYFGGVSLNKLDDTAFLNNANKAYLPKPAGSGAAYYSFRFPGTTGMENVKAEPTVDASQNAEVKAIYDLTGRRIEAITAPGIYIVNGKKVLVK